MQKMDLKGLDLRLLVVFRSLLKTRSVTTTAMKLNMSQPAVSRCLTKLRIVFGDPLFLKGAREMTPTERAQALAEPLADALATLENFFEPAVFDPKSTDRHVRLVTTDYGAMTTLPRLMADLRTAAPGLSIEVSPVTANAFRELSDGQIDLMLYDDSPVPENCRTADLFQDDYACLVRRRHPIVKRTRDRRLDLEDYLAWPHALITVFGGRKGIVDAALESMGYHRQVRFWMPYFSTTPLVMEHADLILTLPRRAADRFADHTMLIVLEAPVEIEPFTYRLVWHERSHNDLGARWLRERIIATASESLLEQPSLASSG